MSNNRYKAEVAASRRIRYAGKRQTFFEGLHRTTLFTSAVLGSSAFVSVISGLNTLTAWLTAIVASVSAMDNVVGFSEKARTYRDQRNRYYTLYCEIVSCLESAYAEDSFLEKRLTIDRDNPPTKRVLDVICRNEEDISRGWKYTDTIHIARFRYLLRHIYDLPPKEWVSVAQKQRLNLSKRLLFKRNHKNRS